MAPVKVGGLLVWPLPGRCDRCNARVWLFYGRGWSADPHLFIEHRHPRQIETK